jgi:hypothetical protein
MNPQFTVIFESAFNILYLVVIWTMVFLMTRYLLEVPEKDRPTARLIRVAFLLLAAGDTGHVGFRVVAYLMGGLDTRVNFLGSDMTLAGLGSLCTAFTVTLFYMILVFVWLKRYNRESNSLTNVLLGVGLIRLVMMALPANDWASVVPPQPMSLYRNIPLMIQGIGVIFLFLSSGYKENDATFRTIGWWIVVSFAFYTPVILFAQKFPLLGMLMIPKTCAYLVVAWVAYQSLWRQKTNLTQKAI